MNKKASILLSLLVLVCFQANAIENEVPQVTPISQNDIEQINTMSDAKALPPISASETIEDWSNAALDRFGLTEFGEHDGKFFVFAQQSVMLKPTDPQFGDAVVNAFDKAMIKLQEEYVMVRFGSTTIDKIKSFYSNRSTDAKTLDLPSPKDPGFLSKSMLVLDKMLDLMGAKLDEELIEMGADRASIENMTSKMKKDTFRDKFVKNTMRQAQGSIAGLIVIQTSLATDSKGTYSIGVIAVASPKTKQIAKDISLKRKSMVTGKGREISTLLPALSQDYLGTFGTRLAYDVDGSPMILSYGIASYRPDSGDDYINDELKSDARSIAISNADGQIAELINGQMNVKEQKKSGEEVRKYVERELRPNSDTIEKTVKNVIKITDKVIKASASAKLQGISTVKRWRYASKDGHKYVGVVRVWKYSTLQAVENLDKPIEAKINKKVEKKIYQSNIRSSAPVNDINDF